MNGNLIKFCIEKKFKFLYNKCLIIVDNWIVNCLILIKEKM